MATFNKYFGSLQVTDGNQYELTNAMPNPTGKTIVKHICTVTKGFRTFCMVTIETGPDQKWYLNETTSGQFEVIQDDEEYKEIAKFVDDWLSDISGIKFGKE
jgi:hypothetical protein